MKEGQGEGAFCASQARAAVLYAPHYLITCGRGGMVDAQR